MTEDSDSPNSRSTLVIMRPRERLRNRPGAVRGTSSYLGPKGGNQKVFSKRYGRAPATSPSASAPASLLGRGSATDNRSTAWSEELEAPRLYHGHPSSEEQEEIPEESAEVIHGLESELSALEGRLLQRNHTALRRPTTAESSTAFAPPTSNQEAAHDPDPIDELESSFCDPNARWDDFGRDLRRLERFGPVANFIAKRYFRTVVSGIEHIPLSGPCLLVANHSGALPIDGLVLKSAIWAAHPKQRHIRWLTEDFVQNLPFVGTFLQRLGAVRASRENALRLLKDGECVVAFPEGFKGYAKPVAQWYRVQRLGRGRIVALCLQAGVPLLPCAIVGGEEATPALSRLEAVERWLGMPYFPITPTFPWLGPLGLVPAPTRWFVDIGPSFLSGHEAARADDPLYVAELTARLRTTLQQRLDRLVAQRKSTWLG